MHNNNNNNKKIVLTLKRNIYIIMFLGPEKSL